MARRSANPSRHDSDITLGRGHGLRCCDFSESCSGERLWQKDSHSLRIVNTLSSERACRQAILDSSFISRVSDASHCAWDAAPRQCAQQELARRARSTTAMRAAGVGQTCLLTFLLETAQNVTSFKQLHCALKSKRVGGASAKEKCLTPFTL